MKKNTLFLFIYISCIFFAENIFYIKNDGNTINLGEVDKPHFRNNEKIFVNNNKYYIKGEESREIKEVITKAVMSSTGYFNTMKIDEFISEIPAGGYMVTNYETGTGEVIHGLKIFSGFDEITPDRYLSYLVIKGGEVFYTDDVLSFSESEKLNIKNINFENLEQIRNRYFKDKKGVYYFNNKNFLKIKNSDVNSFEVLSENYAKDKNNIYYKNKILKGADTNSVHNLKLSNKFEPEVFNLIYDKTGVYFKGNKVSGIEGNKKSNIILSDNIDRIDGIIFKDSKKIYLFTDELGSASLKILDIPLNAKYSGLIFDDEDYLYDPYLNSKIPKSSDFRWITKDIYFNNGRVYFISPMLGITEENFDKDTFQLVYESSFNKVVRDKNSYYIYSGDTSKWDFYKSGYESLKLLDNAKNIGGNIFYDSSSGKYYIIKNTGDVTEINGIKHISKILGESYIIGN